MRIADKSTIIRAIKGFNKKEKTDLITKHLANEEALELDAFLLSQLISPKFKQPTSPKGFLAYSEGDKGSKFEGVWENNIIRFTINKASLHIEVKNREAMADVWGSDLAQGATNPTSPINPPRLDIILPPNLSDLKPRFAQITKLIADVSSDGVLVGAKVEVDDSWAWFDLRKIYPFLPKYGRAIDFTKVQAAFAGEPYKPWVFYPTSYELKSCFGIVMPMVSDHWEELQ